MPFLSLDLFGRNFLLLEFGKDEEIEIELHDGEPPLGFGFQPGRGEESHDED